MRGRKRERGGQGEGERESERDRERKRERKRRREREIERERERQRERRAWAISTTTGCLLPTLGRHLFLHPQREISRSWLGLAPRLRETGTFRFRHTERVSRGLENAFVLGRQPLTLHRKHPTGVERIWHVQDRKGQILALAFRPKFLKPFKVFILCSKRTMQCVCSRISHNVLLISFRKSTPPQNRHFVYLY